MFLATESVNSAPFERGETEVQIFWQGKAQNSSPILRCTFLARRSAKLIANFSATMVTSLPSFSLSLSLYLSLSPNVPHAQYRKRFRASYNTFHGCKTVTGTTWRNWKTLKNASLFWVSGLPPEDTVVSWERPPSRWADGRDWSLLLVVVATALWRARSKREREKEEDPINLLFCLENIIIIAMSAVGYLQYISSILLSSKNTDRKGIQLEVRQNFEDRYKRNVQ